jgi:hypothetical protein
MALTAGFVLDLLLGIDANSSSMSKPIAAAIAGTLAALLAGLWWLQRPEPAPTARPMLSSSKPSPAARATPNSPPRSARPAVVKGSSWDPHLIERVQRKYRYLWADLRLSPQQLEQLNELLLQLERLREVALPSGTGGAELDAVERRRMDQALTRLEVQIRALLDPAQYARYEALRDSDAEQEHLVQYSGGISNVAPLDPAQERAILEARLRHKKRFEAGLRDFGLDRTTLSTEERNYAHSHVAATLQEYRDNFLAEVRPSLTEEQYFLLSSYESTEFARELERLQLLINSK